MGNTKSLKKGFIRKSDFCKKYNISISYFNQVMKEKKYLTECANKTLDGSGYIVKERFTIGVNINNVEIRKNIEKICGTYSQGTFQYREKFLIDVFNVEENTEEVFYDFKLTFGKYLGKKLCSMKTEEEKNYILWLHKQMESNSRTDTKIYKVLEWYINKSIIRLQPNNDTI